MGGGRGGAGDTTESFMTFTFIFVNKLKNNKERNLVQNSNLEGEFGVWLPHGASISLVRVPSCTCSAEGAVCRWQRQSKGPEVGTCLVYLMNSKEAEKSQVVPHGAKPRMSP